MFNMAALQRMFGIGTGKTMKAIQVEDLGSLGQASSSKDGKK